MKATGRNEGFTLVEIAIVLVVIGLLLGGILKGQELINNAKVRSVADRQNSLKVAWFAFIDRYAGVPGDYVLAHVHIIGAASGDGDGLLAETDSPLAFQNLTAAGFLRCGHCTETQTTVASSSANSPTNNYGGVMSIWHDSLNYALPTPGVVGATAPLMVHTGPRIPSNIIGEVDRKIDDGVPKTGDMRFNQYDPTGTQNPNVGECTKLTADGTLLGALAGNANFWRPANSRPPVYGNCGASIMI
ncbi:MAG: prepilin-type N-terminal cleavage/methylation domain-containing protein [Betaproteobacteria bacterium AqS2]|uniref:Prepilin-type N-terminal cleavage/methylation domain-containing protein n=1 Tax=Candidatus Amphirhobacter heronislandensis TaxID=1732024 RepID=A0A930XX96_9GAMM|nr:prepilin-type N-terminal cleavage/methylation domain-containing protein [Betaproteobacteria bacterium AqS2]